MVQFESGKTSFFKCQKKETLMHKINSKWYCWMYGARILQKNSPDHLFKVIRWSGAVLTFCSPKKLLFLQKSLFLDGAQTQIYNLFKRWPPSTNPHTFTILAIITSCCRHFQLSSVFSHPLSMRFQFLLWSFIIGKLPTLWLSPPILPCTTMLCSFGWHLKLKLKQ